MVEDPNFKDISIYKKILFVKGMSILVPDFYSTGNIVDSSNFLDQNST